MDLSEAHFDEIANWDMGVLVNFYVFFGSQIHILQAFELSYGSYT